MGQAFDREGQVLGEASGDTKREVFEQLQKDHPDADEIRIKSAMAATAQQQHDAATRAAQRPSIGRIVIYNHPGSSDGKYPPTQSPAMIQHVAADGSCRLFVFGPKGQHMDDGLTQGDGPCQWNWPPRI